MKNELISKKKMKILNAIIAATWLASSGSAFAAQEGNLYEATYVHRYADANDVTTWDVVGQAKVSQSQDGVDEHFPNDAVFFVSASKDGAAHVFFHGKNKNGNEWLTASKAFTIAPQRTEEISLRDGSKLYVTVKREN